MNIQDYAIELIFYLTSENLVNTESKKDRKTTYVLNIYKMRKQNGITSY